MNIDELKALEKEISRYVKSITIRKGASGRRVGWHIEEPNALNFFAVPNFEVYQRSQLKDHWRDILFEEILDQLKLEEMGAPLPITLAQLVPLVKTIPVTPLSLSKLIDVKNSRLDEVAQKARVTAQANRIRRVGRAAFIKQVNTEALGFDIDEL